jgi:23S rRNA (uracil1939-C5)-methyltransferase
MYMSAGQIVTFKISSVDGLGQGVSKESEKITFIPKTMVGDEGEAVITAERKGVVFAKLLKLTRLSPQRRDPLCPHFSSCPSCHFLHVDYETELSIKKDAFLRIFRKHALQNVEVVGAIRRAAYRNRIQLHYDLTQQKLGMLDASSQSIIPIPHCQITLPELREKITQLYQNQYWMNLASGQPRRGHVEIYSINGELKITWNKPYAEGGFTQVFEEMNTKLKEKLSDWYQDKKETVLLDLFAGNGNLSRGLPYRRRLAVDLYQQLPGVDFLSQDLYSSSALKTVARKLEQMKLNPEVLLLDPPRSGMKDLEHWLEEWQPSYVAYVSCDPHTLARDTANLRHYQIGKAFLIDFFPSTFHFESLLFLERKY